jgi:hypothetical protein
VGAPIGREAQPATEGGAPSPAGWIGQGKLEKITPSGSKYRVPPAPITGPLKSPSHPGIAGAVPRKCELAHNWDSFFPKGRGLRSAPNRRERLGGLVIDCLPAPINAEPLTLCPDPFFSFLSAGEFRQIEVTANPARDSNRKGPVTGIEDFVLRFAHPWNIRPEAVSFQPTRGTISER